MKIIRRMFLLGFSLLLTLAPFQTASAQDNNGEQVRITQVDNSKFPQITLYVSVTDANGEPLAVDPGQIQISEDGTVMQPGQVSGAGEIGPLTTLLVMDISGSMNNGDKLSAAKAAAQAYVGQMRPGDEAGLLTFNTKVTYVQSITTDHAVLSQAINSLKAQDDTAMFDALVQADQILQDYAGRKAVIVLTDGIDNQSKKTLTQVIQTIGNSGLSSQPLGWETRIMPGLFLVWMKRCLNPWQNRLAVCTAMPTTRLIYPNCTSCTAGPCKANIASPIPHP